MMQGPAKETAIAVLVFILFIASSLIAWLFVTYSPEPPSSHEEALLEHFKHTYKETEHFKQFATHLEKSGIIRDGERAMFDHLTNGCDPVLALSEYFRQAAVEDNLRGLSLIAQSVHKTWQVDRVKRAKLCLLGYARRSNVEYEGQLQ